MTEGFQSKFMRCVVYAFLFVIIGGGLSMMYPSFCRRQDLKRRDAEMQERIEAKQREIATLKDNQRRFRSDKDFVESIARQNRRVFPGELVFIFEDD